MIDSESSVKNCPKCTEEHTCLKLKDAHVIWVEKAFKKGECYEIAFDQSPFLHAQFGRKMLTHPVRLDRVSGKQEDTYDYRISCPLCGEFTMEYKNVPIKTDVFVGADRGRGFYIFDWKPDNGLSGNDEATSKIIKQDLIKGQG